jgi:hypothetical protein
VSEGHGKARTRTARDGRDLGRTLIAADAVLASM